MHLKANHLGSLFFFKKMKFEVRNHGVFSLFIIRMMPNFYVSNENLEIMKKQQLKTLTLRKKTISTFESNKVTGGSASWVCTLTHCVPERR
jgi:hypothetical protein